MPPRTRLSRLGRAAAGGTPSPDLLPKLHRQLQDTLQSRASIILERVGEGYRGTSGLGVEASDEAWLDSAAAARLEAAVGTAATVCQSAELGPVLAQLATDRALVVTLEGGSHRAFLVAAAPGVSTPEAVAGGERARVHFELALELTRLVREAALHRSIQDLLLGFSRRIAATLSPAGAVSSLASEMNALFATERASVWLHDRRARELVLVASSDARVTLGRRVATDSEDLAARGLRLAEPENIPDVTPRVLIAPLRGWRRALGTLVFEGDPRGLDVRQFLDGMHVLARQLSVAIENVQLLDEFLQQRRLLEDTFNALTDFVVVADAAQQVVQMNGVFAARVGLEPADILGRPLRDFIGEAMAAWLDAADQAPRTGEVGGGAGGTRQFTDDRLGGIFAATLTPLINSDGFSAGRVLVGRDITSQIQLESEREVLGRRLAQSERLASLGQFVAGIAHEMNNPLQGVLGHLELLIHASEASRPVRSTLRRIHHEADRAAKIVQNLLVFTGSRRMKRVRLRVDRVLSRALASRAAALKLGAIEVTRRTGEAVPSVEGDALLLQQALLNILTNAEHAIRSTSAPGRILAAVHGSPDGLRVRISIRDSGPGIPPGALPHLFDPFFTTKDVGQGTGLGLAITYGIIQEHGGTIQAADAPGGGAEFTIDLPAAPAPTRKGRSKPDTRKSRTKSV